MPYHRFMVALARSTPERTLDAIVLKSTGGVSS
jgi:hypothetical protein